MGTQAVKPTTQNQCKGNVEPPGLTPMCSQDSFLQNILNAHVKLIFSRMKYASILTYFKQHVEDTEFQTGELVLIEIPIYPFHLKHQIQYTCVRSSGNKRQKGRSYHRTITVVFSPCFVQKRNDQGPHSLNIGHDINKFGHRETTG